MDKHGLGKGLAIGLCALSIGLATAITGQPMCIFAFIVLIPLSLYF